MQTGILDVKGLERLDRSIIVQGGELVRLTDTRTGLVVEVSLTRDGCRSTHIDAKDISLLGSLGFLGDMEVSDVRSAQRSYRSGWQSELTDRALADLSSFILANVAYYKNSGSDFPKYSFQSLTDLSHLPVITRDDVSRNVLDFFADPRPEDCAGLDEIVWARTSGSTADPMIVPVNMACDRVPPGYERVWNVWHEDTVPRTAILTAPDCLRRVCGSRNSTARVASTASLTFHLSSIPRVFDAVDETIERFIEELHSYRPHFILASPAYLAHFSTLALGLGLKPPPIDSVLSSYQYMTHGQHRAISSFFKAPVYNTYTATELGGCQVAVQCRYGNWHIRQDHVVVETGNQITDDGVATFLITTHANRRMPLVRYRVGDVGKLLDVDCDCAISEWACLEFHGREAECLKVRDSVFTVKVLDDALKVWPGILSWQFARGQSEHQPVMVEIIPNAGEAANVRQLEDYLADFLRCRTKVGIVKRHRQMESGKVPLVY